MLNKTDKLFILTGIVMIMGFILPIVPMFYSIATNTFLPFEISFISFFIFILFILPICAITQLITLSIKIFSKKYDKKDYIILIVNIVSLIFSISVLFVIWFGIFCMPNP